MAQHSNQHDIAFKLKPRAFESYEVSSMGQEDTSRGDDEKVNVHPKHSNYVISHNCIVSFPDTSISGR